MNLVFDPTKTMDENIKHLRETAKALGSRLANLNREFPTVGDETYWFPASVKPVHVGLYQKLFEIEGRKGLAWAWWDQGWYMSSPTREGAVRAKNGYKSGIVDGFAWRGCKEQK